MQILLCNGTAETKNDDTNNTGVTDTITDHGKTKYLQIKIKTQTDVPLQ
jgi:hypothetical protein